MAFGVLTELLPRLRSTAQPTESDADLLDRFVAARDPAAFEALVRRHGPMVFGVCRRVLRHVQDAEDATQATFLVLLNKAASVSPRSKLAGWLHIVAHTTALKARERAARRAEVESRAPARSNDAMMPDPTRDEAEAILDQELTALPDRYRLPIILCDLEGRLRSEVARSLRCSEGTLSSRLTRGRRLLAERLKRRGVQLSAGTLAVILTEGTSAAVEPLLRSLSPAALATVPPTVAGLATGVMKSMFLKKLQTAVAVVAVVVASAFGLAALVSEPMQAAAPVPAKPAPADDKASIEALADLDSQLLLNRKVIRELNCDIHQLDKIMDKIEAAHEVGEKITNAAVAKITADPNAGNDPDAFEKALKDAQEVGDKEVRKAVTEVVTTMLTPAQRKRLRELDLQSRGYEAFTTPAVAKELNLTDKQKEQMTANVRRVEEGIQRAFEQPGADPNVPVQIDYEKVMKDAREDGMKGALEVLTADQKAAWKKLIGEPVKFPLPRPGDPFGIGIRPFQRGGVPVPPVVAPPAVAPPAAPEK
jgi:RNA polymerase sigma factor (sigma-70 family)